ncbi:unnamed protein product (macronuclear) [Paramecium tetraurelia]|uniref:MIF4G domain-containing protein n=1 Tax=Paramecium tetraurelia TaxID=5888 RepID=A0BGR3_PARTE|nr:uncharacterized protein GSPATT00028765001 [Paramecium tetraurelia]CAK57730.1 unnamed protein product [Paramecium tetraurelia]|eukprot:XP_001425128.1 hypothetical protein (macronuclear) [Paramecium tetraurelia strain d4-2]
MNYKISQRPPPPKFNWNLVAQKQIKETKQMPELQKSDKRRLKQVNLLIDEMLKKLSQDNPQFLSDLNQDTIKAKCFEMLNSELIEKVKSKKYQSIACALIIQSLRILLVPLRVNEVIQIIDVNDKQVRKILNQLNQFEPFNEDAFTIAFMARICKGIGFNQKFQTLCKFFFSNLKNLNLIQGEHEHVIASVLIKLSGDFVFKEKGGINLNAISEMAGCCQISLKNVLQKLSPYIKTMYDSAFEFYQRTK